MPKKWVRMKAEASKVLLQILDQDIFYYHYDKNNKVRVNKVERQEHRKNENITNRTTFYLSTNGIPM